MFALSSSTVFIGLFALGEGLKAVEIYWPVLQTVCFVNVGCFVLLGLLSRH